MFVIRRRPNAVEGCPFTVAQAWRNQGLMPLRGWSGPAVHFVMSDTAATVMARLARRNAAHATRM